MYFSKWRKITSNQNYLSVCNAIQEFIVDEWNEEDTSVGMYSISKIDSDLVDDINNNYEDCYVKSWEKDSVVLEVEGKYWITIKLEKFSVGLFEWEYQWEIVDFKVKPKSTKILKTF